MDMEANITEEFIRVLNETGMMQDEKGVIFMAPFSDDTGKMLLTGKSPEKWAKARRMRANPDGA